MSETGAGVLYLFGDHGRHVGHQGFYSHLDETKVSDGSLNIRTYSCITGSPPLQPAAPPPQTPPSCQQAPLESCWAARSSSHPPVDDDDDDDEGVTET